MRAPRPTAEPVLLAPPYLLLTTGTLVAMALSTQYFFQPFVWRYWDIDAVFAGWANVAIDNLLLVEPVVMALIAAGKINGLGPVGRAAAIAGAIVAGAVVGDMLDQLRSGGAPSLMVTLLQSLRIALLIASVMPMIWAWRAGAIAAANSADMRARDAAVRAATDVNELEALRRQIEPHFLFNTLATVQQLHLSDIEAGHAMLAQLLTYVRQSLAMAGEGRVRLADEIALVNAYLIICRLRMGERLAMRIDVPTEVENAAIPPLVLITLVENAIKHGLAPSPTGGSVIVTARREAAMLELSVIDDGVGLGALGGGRGIGLANTLRRLRLIFGSNTALSLSANLPRGASAQLRMPFELTA